MNHAGRRPSPALIVAAIALVFAMVGTSVAQDPVAKLTRSKVKEIAKKQITKAAPRLSVAKAKSADSATSAAIATKAESATTATSANTAQSVNGLKIEKFSRASTTATSPTGEPFVSAGGLNLSFVCLGGGHPRSAVNATTTADNARI